MGIFCISPVLIKINVTNDASSSRCAQILPQEIENYVSANSKENIIFQQLLTTACSIYNQASQLEKIA